MAENNDVPEIEAVANVDHATTNGTEQEADAEAGAENGESMNLLVTHQTMY